MPAMIGAARRPRTTQAHWLGQPSCLGVPESFSVPPKCSRSHFDHRSGGVCDSYFKRIDVISAVIADVKAAFAINQPSQICPFSIFDVRVTGAIRHPIPAWVSGLEWAPANLLLSNDHRLSSPELTRLPQCHTVAHPEVGGVVAGTGTGTGTEARKACLGTALHSTEEGGIALVEPAEHLLLRRGGPTALVRQLSADL